MLAGRGNKTSPMTKSLTEKYLKIREERIRNIAFDANATDGGEIKPMRTLFFNDFVRYAFAVQPPSCDGWYRERHVRPD